MKCSKCGNEFEGRFCPECGTPANEQPQQPIQSPMQQPPMYQNPAMPYRKKGGCLKGGLIALAILVGIGIIGSFINNSISTPTSGKNVSSAVSDTGKAALSKALADAKDVDYNVLYKDYMDNAIGADEKYKDKMLILSGKVDRIDREIAGNPYVTFSVGDFKDIRITFSKDEESKVAKFKKGQTIKIVGKCKGTLISTTVALNDCLVVE